MAVEGLGSRWLVVQELGAGLGLCDIRVTCLGTGGNSANKLTSRVPRGWQEAGLGPQPVLQILSLGAPLPDSAFLITPTLQGLC